MVLGSWCFVNSMILQLTFLWAVATIKLSVKMKRRAFTKACEGFFQKTKEGDKIQWKQYLI